MIGNLYQDHGLVHLHAGSRLVQNRRANPFHCALQQSHAERLLLQKVTTKYQKWAVVLVAQSNCYGVTLREVIGYD
jgi:hypothetical protein